MSKTTFLDRVVEYVRSDKTIDKVVFVEHLPGLILVSFGPEERLDLYFDLTLWGIIENECPYREDKMFPPELKSQNIGKFPECFEAHWMNDKSSFKWGMGHIYRFLRPTAKRKKSTKISTPNKILKPT